MKILTKLENLFSPIFKKVEGALNVEAKIFIGSIVVVALFVAGLQLFKPNDLTNSSVMITNVAKTSGGTGIILESSETMSKVLTNSHVCHVVEKGGLVTGVYGTFLVSSYKRSKSHDLCLITVEGNLKASTKIADKAPVSYYENALISGHPALMPNVVTSGHFSGRKVITVMKGMKPCTPADLEDPGKAIICMLAGGIPIAERYDSTLVTATIMAGSSGSGVYNSNKELAGVVFAGSGNLSYAWTVPYESMINFINVESHVIETFKPDNEIGLEPSSGEQGKAPTESEMLAKLAEACSGPQKEKIKEACTLLEQDMIWKK